MANVEQEILLNPYSVNCWIQFLSKHKQSIFYICLWQNARVSEGLVSRTISQEAMRGGWQNEVKQKKGEEREKGEEKSQLSHAGCTSLSQDR